MPHMIIIAGPNGAGKSTAAPGLLQGAVNIGDFVNADVIAQGLSAFQPEKEAIRAGKIMLNRIKGLAKKNTNFAFETTLASKTFVNWMPALKQQGYQLHLIFLWLQSADLAVHRVQERVDLGGHFVPEETIRRRYRAGIKNFFNLYMPLLNSWQLYDNSDASNLSLIAECTNSKIALNNPNLWENLKENNYD